MISMESMKKMLDITDSRIKITNELLQGIRIVKFYAWEKSFMDRVEQLRSEELKHITVNNDVGSFVIFIFFLLPVVITLSCFGIFVLTGNTLTAPIVFRAVAYFAALQMPLINLPYALTGFIFAKVSDNRIIQYLSKPDLDLTHRAASEEFPLEIQSGNFSWMNKTESKGIPASPASTRMSCALSDINIRVARGSLTAVVGEVGSGKSNLIAALLGDMHKQSGFVRCPRKVGFVPQKSWIQNASIRENICFHSSYDRDRYWKVLSTCALKPDLKILPGGDKIEIGERGINLSGGQKQRVALCRAVYANYDTLIFDDPFSALDANVAHHIFHKCILGKGQGGLHNKTRLLVTNHLHFLPDCDYIYVLKV